jgi:peroxiredoxin
MYGKQGLVVVGISMDREPSLVPPYILKYGLTFLNLLDPTGKVFPSFNVRYTPSNFFINRRGKVIGGSLGYRDWDSAASHRFIKALLAEKQVPLTRTVPVTPVPGS